ncbi:MAG TPA: S8 family peptidase [Blastocatellia bacterium]|nr:S8 family peptidase [Blastocatellia bacterium]
MNPWRRVVLPLVLSAFATAAFQSGRGSTTVRASGTTAGGDLLIALRHTKCEGASNELSRIRSIVPAARTVERLSGAACDGSYRITLEQGVSTSQVVAEVLKHPDVEFAEPDYPCKLADTIPNDPLFEFMWSLRNLGEENRGLGADVGVVKAWDLTTGRDDLVVAVLDTGIDLSHPDLAPNAWTNPGEIPGNGIDDDRNGFVDDVNGWNFLNGNSNVFEDPETDYHGTHVAGIIGAAGNNEIGVTGVAWHVKIMGLKFLDGHENRGFISNAIKAINYVIQEKNRGVDVVAINASWISPGRSQMLRRAIRAAGKAGILFVCAAGNDGLDTDEEPVYPVAESRSLTSMIAVAALNRWDGLEPYSNYGHDTVTLGGPGSEVLGLAPGGEYRELSGTSMAAPHVTGVAVLLRSIEPSLTPTEIRQRLIVTADPVPELGGYCISSGRVNAFNALTWRVAARQDPIVARVEATKRALTVDGAGFLPGRSLIEINGNIFQDTKQQPTWSVANGTLTRLILRLGKDRMDEFCPLHQEVPITVVDALTGDRSNTFIFTRRKEGEPE